MLRPLKVLIGMLLLASLVACGDAPEPLPTLASLPDTDTAPTEQADTASQDEPAQDNEGSSATNAELSNLFTATVSGAVEGPLRRVISVDTCINVFSLTYSNMFSAVDNDIEGNIIFTFRPDATEGPFVFDTSAETFQPIEVSASISDPADGPDYIRMVSAVGDITALPSAPGDAYAGTFTLVLDNFDFLSGAEATAEVTVTGEFVQVVDELCEVD